MVLFDTIVDLTELGALEMHINRIRMLVRTDLVDDVATLVSAQAVKRIETTKKTPDGEKWPAAKKDYGHPLLYDTGKLANSIHAIRQGADSAMSWFGDYAPGYAHQLGVKGSRAGSFSGRRSGTGAREAGARRSGPTQYKIPPRPFMGVGREDADEIQQYIDAWVASIDD